MTHFPSVTNASSIWLAAVVYLPARVKWSPRVACSRHSTTRTRRCPRSAPCLNVACRRHSSHVAQCSSTVGFRGVRSTARVRRGNGLEHRRRIHEKNIFNVTRSDVVCDASRDTRQRGIPPQRPGQLAPRHRSPFECAPQFRVDVGECGAQFLVGVVDRSGQHLRPRRQTGPVFELSGLVTAPTGWACRVPLTEAFLEFDAMIRVVG